MVTGFICVAGTAVILGIMPTIQKQIMLNGMPLNSLMFFTNLTISIVCLALALIKKRSLKASVKQAAQALLMGVFGMLLTPVLLNSSYLYLPYVSLPATVLFAVLTPATGTLVIPVGLTEWAMVIGGSGLFTVCGYFLMMFGISKLGASTAAFVSMLEPIVSVVFGTIWFNDPITIGIVAGGCLVMASILLITIDGYQKGRQEGNALCT